tara:strand:+ start:1505 stop:2218 length:714 start_codon:yes stop_codon:yes gene_type:complete
MAYKATYLGSNGWIIDFTNCKLLIDPWIEGELIFPPGEWFFKGSLRNKISTPQGVDTILITQSLPDHCHIPSLMKFKKDITIICPKSALNLLKENGFTNVNVISPSEQINLKGLTIEATNGAKVPQVENGYIVESPKGSFYIEPHGYFDENIKGRKLDAVITPTKDLSLPLFGDFIKGTKVLPKLIDCFNPNYILSSTTGGDAEFTGILNNFIKVEEIKRSLQIPILDLNCMESVMI